MNYKDIENYINNIYEFIINHINNYNNELTNLRYLCPNCHALTETYRGKNKALKSMCRDFTPAT